jgi:hypothetical protein
VAAERTIEYCVVVTISSMLAARCLSTFRPSAARALSTVAMDIKKVLVFVACLAESEWRA